MPILKTGMKVSPLGKSAFRLASTARYIPISNRPKTRSKGYFPKKDSFNPVSSNPVFQITDIAKTRRVNLVSGFNISYSLR